MAQDKKTIVIYSNWEQTFENLTDDEAGRLIKHLFRYVNDKNPIAPDRVTELVFEPIKAVLKDDLKKYEKVKEEKSLQGRLGNLKRWNNDLFLLVENQSISIDEAEKIVVQRKLSLSDKIIADATKTSQEIAVNDNDNDNVLNINNSLMSEIKISDDKKVFYLKEQEISLSDNEKKHLLIAEGFRKLFIKNLKEKKSPTKHQENAKYKSYVDPIRLILEKEEATEEQLRSAYNYLNSLEGEFWKANILSTDSLRKNIQKLLVKMNTVAAPIKNQQEPVKRSAKDRF